ncbi:LCP family protein [Modestobacter altitudinis]|uniref:LCP family protein n=1 Tax=Modestobacter altitudinis TaxID=2213158 RepID=UPI001FE4D98F|nr:LCP family protein [Modestobacter altitudinis]
MGPRPLPPRLDPRVGRQRQQAETSDRATGRGRLTLALRVVAGLLSLALVVGSGWGWYLGRVASATVNRTDALPASGNEGSGSTGAAMNMLLVGTDSRSELTEQQQDEFHTGGDSGLNTDTMILVHVPADGSAASFVSFPRDSYVDIPGHGQDKLNAAYAYGYADADASATEDGKLASGAQLLVQTISQLTGLQVDHYAEVDLLGFFNLSSVVGGVEVNLCKAVDDSEYSGAVFPAGVQTISGADALKFVRQRHGLPRGDFDRIVRQQAFIAGILRKMLSEDVLLDLGKQRELVQSVAQSMTVDQSLDLMQLAQQMQSVKPGSVDFQTVPNVGTDKEGGKSIVRLEDADTLHAFFADLSSDPEDTAESSAAATTSAAPSVVPGDVTVDVYNGSGTSGLAASAAEALAGAGYVVGTTGNADTTSLATTEIRYGTDGKTLAKATAKAIPGAKLVSADDVAAGHVQLVIGTDFNGVGQAVTPVTSAAASSSDAAPGGSARSAADTSCIN